MEHKLFCHHHHQSTNSVDEKKINDDNSDNNSSEDDDPFDENTINLMQLQIVPDDVHQDYDSDDEPGDCYDFEDMDEQQEENNTENLIISKDVKQNILFNVMKI